MNGKENRINVEKHNNAHASIEARGYFWSLFEFTWRWCASDPVSFTVTTTQAGNTQVVKQVAALRNDFERHQEGWEQRMIMRRRERRAQWRQNALTIISVTEFGCPVLDFHQYEGLCPSHQDTSSPFTLPALSAHWIFSSLISLLILSS